MLKSVLLLTSLKTLEFSVAWNLFEATCGEVTFQVGLDTSKNLTEATEPGLKDFQVEPFKTPCSLGHVTANSRSVCQHEMLGPVGGET